MLHRYVAFELFIEAATARADPRQAINQSDMDVTAVGPPVKTGARMCDGILLILAAGE
jgi:hypothetical protein